MAELPEPTETTRAAVAAESVPILDLSAYMNGDAGAREQAAADLRYIQENLGYYYITNHGVSAELIERSFEKVAEFFALPEVEKRKILVNRHQLGFVPAKASIMKTELTDANTVADLNEGLSLMRERAPDDPKVVADVRFSGLNPWPDGVPGLRETFLEYHVEMDALAKRLLPLMRSRWTSRPTISTRTLRTPIIIIATPSILLPQASRGNRALAPIPTITSWHCCRCRPSPDWSTPRHRAIGSKRQWSPAPSL